MNSKRTRLPHPAELAVALNVLFEEVGQWTYAQRLARWKKHNKICYKCSGPAVEGRTMCEKHLKLTVERAQQAQQTRMKYGFCRRCQSLPVPGRKMCANHLKLASEAVLRCYEKRVRARDRRKEADGQA